MLPLRLKLPPPPRLMLLDPPRLNPPPPRPPPPPPRPPRASTSWTMNAARLTKAPTIASREIVPRMLLSLVGGQLDFFRIRVGHEREVGIREGRVDLPAQSSNEGRPRRVGPVEWQRESIETGKIRFGK